MTGAVDVSAVIVSHGHDAMLPACVGSLAAALDGLTYEVILIDNLGGPAPPWLVRAPFAKWIANARPEGFAANVNRGYAAARGRHLLILNPDTEHAGGRVADLVAALEAGPRIGVVGCALLNADGSPQRNYRRFPSLGVFLARGLGADRWPWRPEFYRRRMMGDVELGAPRAVDWIFGAFMLLRAADFARLGGMDARFRLYYEDVDLCWRFRRSGLETWVFPGVAFKHVHLRESAKRPFGKTWRWHGRSAALYFWKTWRRSPAPSSASRET